MSDADFFRAWAEDDEGSRVLTGLTVAETAELHRLFLVSLAGRARTETADEHRARTTRYLELFARHERARTAIINAKVSGARSATIQ